MKTKNTDTILIICLLMVFLRLFVTDQLFSFMYQIFYPSIGAVILIMIILCNKRGNCSESVVEVLLSIVSMMFPLLFLSLFPFSMEKVSMTGILFTYYILIFFLFKLLILKTNIDNAAVITLIISISIYILLYFNSLDLFSVRWIVIAATIIAVLSYGLINGCRR